MQEQTIFDLLYPKFKIDKKIRLIELFAGYGSTKLAWDYLGVDVQSWKICEWAVKSIQAYKDIHFCNDNNDYSESFDIDYIKQVLFDKGISSDYNEPMSKEKIGRMSEKNARQVFNNIVATHNLVNIQKVKGKDLEIVNKDEYIYICTYSFPCQDLSASGKKLGMSDTSTRSGMLWEVERILTECKELDSLPQVLLMENVVDVHNERNKADFLKWVTRLEELGYKNYWQDLMATDYGIPQTRNRCFMVSLLGDYSYSFPPKQELKLRLKDMLEDNVSDKYYLSDKMKKYIFSKDDTYNVNPNSLKLDRDIAVTKTTREGWTRADASDYIRVIRKYGMFDKGDKKHQAGSIYDKNGLAPTLDTATGGYRQPMIEEDYITCLLKNKGTEISRITNNANTLMARDYKGFGNQEMNAVIQIERKKE